MDENDSTRVGPLDMSKTIDRRLFNRAIKEHDANPKRWSKADEEFRNTGIQALMYALKLATERKDHRAVNGIVQSMCIIDRINQAEEHFYKTLKANAQVVDSELSIRDAQNKIANDPDLAEKLKRLGSELIDKLGEM